jgi:hypothetical protein
LGSGKKEREEKKRIGEEKGGEWRGGENRIGDGSLVGFSRRAPIPLLMRAPPSLSNNLQKAPYPIFHGELGIQYMETFSCQGKKDNRERFLQI